MARGGEEDLRPCIPLEELRNVDVPKVGGKSASLGEMIGGLADAGVPVPGGFSTTAQAYKDFLLQDNLGERINKELDDESIYTDVTKLQEVGARVRKMVMDQPLQAEFEAELKAQWERVSEGNEGFQVAVRSSATAEDLPDASFAGQQETYLNVSGYETLKEKVHECYASLFTDRAISYRHDKGFDHKSVQLCACVQKMVRSEEASAGVMFTLDTESGFQDVVFVTSAWGLGETVVGGTVNPDEFYVFKPTLKEGKNAVVSKTMGSKLVKMVYSKGGGSETIDTTDDERKTWSVTDEEVTQLAEIAGKIEQHYGRPMDIEWCKDADDQKLYVVQARPETVASRQKKNVLETYTMNEKGSVLCEGRAVGGRIGSGKVNMLTSLDDMASFSKGDVLVADMTDPDWEPVMSKASAIITNRGGRTCHAAIIARELGIPAIVGSGDATDKLKNGDAVTVSCAEGDTGFVYQGELDFTKDVKDLEELPTLGFKIMMNVGNPSAAFEFGQIPNEGIGLARLEFVINNAIGIHPKALLNYDTIDADTKAIIDKKIKGYSSPVEFYVSKIAEGVATLAASVYPKRIIVRLSDFKSNEYKSLIGGEAYEPDEENPMIGFRGCGRYADPAFEDCFALELKAMKRVREEMGMTNVELMIPFVRTLDMAADVLDILKKNGLERGVNDLKVNMMAELPSNVFLAEEFLEYFDGFSIGSNDLTQLTLGLDRDSGLVAQYFDEENPAVMKGLSMLIQAAKKKGKYVGICGQGPSDKPELAKWLMDEGIDSVSLNPDSVIPTWLFLGGKSE
jgi:pyruvate,water dikinase